MTDSRVGNTAAFDGADRRKQPHLREIVDKAYQTVYPLLDSNKETLESGSSHFIRVELHDAFPNLHPQDVAILSVSIMRVFREQHRPGI
jgi:hypothetical protein